MRVEEYHVNTNPVRVAVTGAAGQIGYSLIFRVASGQLLGPEQPVILQLLEVPQAMSSLEGVAMELDDCAFGLLSAIELTDQADKAFDRVEAAILVGSRPRTKGMERKDLLEANGEIFITQGQALNNQASAGVRVLVVGNPANTNCLIAMANAPDIPSDRFSAMTRLDHNRALSQVALRAGVSVNDVSRMTIWGNHSATQYPDLFHCRVGARSAADVIGDSIWMENTFIPTVQQRGSAIIEARGASSAASAANAAIDHLVDWFSGTSEGDWVSMAVRSDGHYGVPEGLISSFPVTCSNGDWSVVPDLGIDDFSRGRIEMSVDELLSERNSVASLGLI